MLKDGFIQLYDSSYKRIQDIKFDKSDNVDNTLVSLYATVIEQTGSAVILIQQGYYGGIEAILRSVLEAYIDIVNLTNNKGYLDQLLLEFYESQKKVGDQVAKGNRWLVGIDPAVAAKRHGEWVKKYDDLHKTAKPHLNKFQRFEVAKEEETYRAIYKTLCDEAHNNITALTSRHLREKSDGDIEIVVFAEPEAEHADMVYDTWANILQHANIVMHTHYQSPALDDIKAAGVAMDKVRDDYMKAG